jgi:hypothetical protein
MHVHRDSAQHLGCTNAMLRALQGTMRRNHGKLCIKRGFLFPFETDCTPERSQPSLGCVRWSRKPCPLCTAQYACLELGGCTQTLILQIITFLFCFVQPILSFTLSECLKMDTKFQNTMLLGIGCLACSALLFVANPVAADAINSISENYACPQASASTQACSPLVNLPREKLANCTKPC